MKTELAELTAELESLPLKDKRVLVLGVGDGTLVAQLMQHCKVLMGFEPDPTKIEAARKNAPGTFFRRAVQDAEKFFQNKSFDFVVCGPSLIGRTRDDIQALLQQVGRALFGKGMEVGKFHVISKPVPLPATTGQYLDF